MTDFPILKVGVSSCLLGEEVRYDGKHKRDSFLTRELAPHVTWFPVCPEVEVGMGVPREPIRLEGSPDSPRLVTHNTQIDHTNAMKNWTQERLKALAAEQLCGFVLKSRSPSCGLFRIPILQPDGSTFKDGRGLFATALTQHFPMLPVEDEGRLNDPRLRENFIKRMYVYHRWTTFLHEKPKPAGLVQFHTAHKMLFLAHHEPSYRKMGPLVAQAGSMEWNELITLYGETMNELLSHLPTRGTHTNVLQHFLGYLKTTISSDEKQEFLELIRQYREGSIPLVVPLTLLRHHFRHHAVPEWVHQQFYLAPYPKQLMLQNMV